MLEEGLAAAVQDIHPMMIKLHDTKKPAVAVAGSEDSSSSEEGADSASGSDSDNNTRHKSSEKIDRAAASDEDIHVRISFEDLRVSEPYKRDVGTASSSSSGVASSGNSSDAVNADGRVTPREARERGISYVGAMDITAVIAIDGQDDVRHRLRLGDLPIMIRSSKCHLANKSPVELISMKEEANEKGGYFVCNGIERVIRLLQVPRRNHPMAIERNSYKNRGTSYSNKGIQMRCVRSDQSSVTITLHYLNNGGATMKFTLRKQEFLLPVVTVLKAIMTLSDKEIYDRIVQGDNGNTFLTTRLEVLLRDAKQNKLVTQSQNRAFLGKIFRNYLPISDVVSDEAAGALLIEKYFFVHVERMADKCECLLLMLRKLFAFAQGRCCQDNADALMNHELLLPGHLINMILKEKLEEIQIATKLQITRDFNMNKKRTINEFKTNGSKYVLKHMERTAVGTGGKIHTFLSTGNVISSTGLDLMQVSGYTVVAERLNILRYMSHFQSVHRGQFFTTMKTTAVRKLLPESWGFMCPVHTPDGSPCGLLNHLAKECVTISFPTRSRMPLTSNGELVAPSPHDINHKNSNYDKTSSFLSVVELCRLLAQMGMIPCGTGVGDGQQIPSLTSLPVCIDGRVIGAVGNSKDADSLVQQLRFLKATGGNGNWDTYLDPTMEIAYIPVPKNPEHRVVHGYAGIFLFTSPGRMIRPVINIHTNTIEWIGPMEQPYLEIACLSDDIRANETTHMEIEPTQMLSHVASLTPFSDQNQSPRNMYQCQMGKQTMGTPAHAMKHRNDNKLYRIQNPQACLVQTKAHREYCMDEYPQGTNAIVAVIAYTGFDMEDAMIINRSAFQRGFGHGSMYKTMVIDLDEEEKRAVSTGARPALIFANIKSPPLPSLSYGDSIDNITGTTNTTNMSGEKFVESLDSDGLPLEGEAVQYGEAVCCIVDTISGEHRIIKHKSEEKAYVDTVRVLGSSSNTNKSTARKVSITMRYPRKPVIGDKFSSRHGQKGTLSVLWPQENMPFSESGMSPDILINPHAFPSRMTIGMLVESMAGKAGAMHGHFQDGTPFQYHEKHRAVDYVGEQLLKSGYNYYGAEPLYSGISGKVMQCDIFIGVVYYQRLRHMVSDKSQVRSTGAVQSVTRQPVKGRKKGGGIRLGEMERDALLSHGVAYCLHDRLMGCSDAHQAHVCSTCGGLLSVSALGNNVYQKRSNAGSTANIGSNVGQNTNAYRNKFTQFCSTCNSSDGVKPIMLPYVYRYLVNELAGMGVKLKLTIDE